MSQTRKMKCRWCGCDITLHIPEDPDNDLLRRFMLDPHLRCGCDRCTDYHRARINARDLLQSQALFLNRRVSDTKIADARNAIRNTVAKLVQLAEDHYMLSGLQKDVDEFVSGVCDNPDSATIMANMFEQGVRQLAQETHLFA